MLKIRLFTPVLLIAVACSSAQQPVAAPPAPIITATVTPPAPPVLQPPAGALRVADRAQLRGTELGTMWTFENPPLTYWQQAYNFTASKEWLDRVRLASVRYGEYCSASFVSPSGLVMTNHHCARECIESNSRDGTDYVELGFYAARRSDEKLCPNLFLDQLIAVEDVTARVQSGAKAEQIQSECQQRTQLTCQVVSLFHGGQYQLYQYKRYSPVKLVFAPELQAGFFGGDPDNFTYPRYNLDVSFVRAYEANGTTPASTPHYFKWRAEGPKPNELVLVTGNPGSTSRQITVSRMMYERDFRHPFLIQFLRAQSALLHKIAKQSREAEQQVREDIFELENSLKSFEGQYAGLQDTLLLGQKIRWEREFRRRINNDAALQAQYGDVWDRIADIQAQKLQLSPILNITNAQWLGAPHLVYAAALVDRNRNADAEAMLRSSNAPNEMISEALLITQMQMAARWLPDSVRVRFIQPGEMPEAAARRIIQSSRIMDPAFRAELMKGDEVGIQSNQDPALILARAMLSGRTEMQQRWDSLIAEEGVQQERLAKALFATFGTNLPPDATFTLRISDGVVKGYPYNGTLAPPVTTFYGMFGRATEFKNEMPFTLPRTFANRQNALNMATPLNFVSTNDITGGNSGSPVIDRDARIVGLAFDSNMEALPNEFLYQNVTGRAISVHAAGITEALRNIYRAEALLRELTGAAR